MRILEHVIADPQVLRDPAQILQLERFAFSGQIVEGAFALGFENPLLGDALRNETAPVCSAVSSSA